MTSDTRKLLFKEELLSDIWEEIDSLHGDELDAFLQSVGLDVKTLARSYTETIRAAITQTKRAEFDRARNRVSNQETRSPMKIVTLDVGRKRQILAAINERVARTKEMTVAARNRKIDAEQDLDTFLEACVRLGLIDEEGNLRD